MQNGQQKPNLRHKKVLNGFYGQLETVCLAVTTEGVSTGTETLLVIAASKHKHKHKHCLQCFDAVGWAAGRASGL